MRATWLAAALSASLTALDTGRPAPAAPSADAGADQVVEIGSAVTLDGSRSLNAAGGRDGLTFRWRQVAEPDVTDALPAFECPADWADNYGTRVRGFLYPPVTGEYTFWVASDDSGGLWLSSDDSPTQARRIAAVAGWTPPRAWETLPGQQSRPVRLEAGRRYYIEALQKEGGGGDHLAVAWAYPGHEREVIPGRSLSPLDGPAGSIEREVWTGVSGDMLRDLTASPTFPGGAAAALANAEAATASLNPPRAGRYVLELTVSDGQETATDRVSVLVTDALRNGDFEAGGSGQPEGWLADGAAGATLKWEEHGGLGDSRCLSVAATDPANAAWRQPLQLAPYTPYLLKGFVRGNGLRAEGKCPATIGVTLWKAENGPRQDVESLDWTPFEVDFATDPSGKVDVLCKLGVFSERSAGTVYFDNLTLARNPEVETFESQRFVLHLYRDQVDLATRSAVERMMANIDRVCDAYTELTGYDPGQEKQSAWAPDKWGIDALGWSGNPVLWSGDRKVIAEDWPREGYCAEVFLHELAHNWDNERYTFHGHFNELKMAYALETLNLGIAEDGWTRGKDTRHRWEFRTRRNRELGICDELVQTYRNLQIVEQVGWEPFRQTYRYFLALPDDQVSPDAWGKFKLWHDKVTEFSGFDAWSVYTPEEIGYAKAYYAPHPDPQSLPSLAEIAEGVREVSLTEAKWESAQVGWEEPKYGIQGSGAAWYTQAVYAHAPSSYVYPLAGGWKTLSATCGLARGNPGSVVFVVRGDGEELFRSEVVRDFGEHPVQVDVTGVERLELVVEDGGDGKNSDHGCWFAPRLTR